MAKKTFLILLLAWGYVSNSEAATITGGQFTLLLDYFGEHPVPITITGEGFSASFGLVSTTIRPTDRSLYTYGATYSLNFTLAGPHRYMGGSGNGLVFNSQAYVGETLYGPNMSFGAFTDEDKLFQKPEFETTLRIVSDPLIMPFGPIGQDVNTPFTLRGNFTATGSICGYLRGSNTFGPQPCQLNLPNVTGSGHWELQVKYGRYAPSSFGYGYWGGMDIDSFKFYFDAPISEVPEPATALSTLGALAGLAVARRRQSRRFLPGKKGISTS